MIDRKIAEATRLAVLLGSFALEGRAHRDRTYT